MLNQREVNNWSIKLLNKVFSGELKEYSILKDGETYLFCEEPDEKHQIVYRSYLPLHVSDVLNLILTPGNPRKSLDNGAFILYKSQRTFAIKEFRQYLINEVSKSDFMNPELVEALETGLEEIQWIFKGKTLIENSPPINYAMRLTPLVWAKDLLNNIDGNAFYIFWDGRGFSFCREFQPQYPPSTKSNS
ncbi:hypothetical protein [Desulfosporosinus hippei]|uniref:Uncharacterized protein n=1 Tax=Desulfosporosinus hippei DSM 8344 TaxID=1121419 RepID=A0A1G8CG92_9FIRM|nr:hypothetical protein [Desulfosporosinus hippei]SDH44486.1 hypothetical protein SAMN05443529_11393 [Desulfosporosinus hippei DSM 8344]